MKRTLTFSAVILLIAMLSFSCKESAPVVVKKTTKLTAKNTKTPLEYRTWKARWERTGKAYTAATLTEYFTMPLIDLEEFALENNHVAARFVLGMDSTSTGLTPHLLLVGVDSTGTSMIPPYAPGKIYDVTRPCPHACGMNSIN